MTSGVIFLTHTVVAIFITFKMLFTDYIYGVVGLKSTAVPTTIDIRSLWCRRTPSSVADTEQWTPSVLTIWWCCFCCWRCYRSSSELHSWRRVYSEDESSYPYLSYCLLSHHHMLRAVVTGAVHYPFVSCRWTLNNELHSFYLGITYKPTPKVKRFYLQPSSVFT